MVLNDDDDDNRDINELTITRMITILLTIRNNNELIMIFMIIMMVLINHVNKFNKRKWG